jgi:micrococcal nuclease
VTEVIDGDTITIAGGDRVRYIGIDTPEKDEPFYLEAWQANHELVEGKAVRLERDVSETDKYGRLLRYVWVDGTMVNAELVRRGLAEAKAYPPDTKYQSYLEQAEAEARQAGRGMWAK